MAIISSGSVSRRYLYHSQWLRSSSADFLLSGSCPAFLGFFLFLVRFSYVCFVILFSSCVRGSTVLSVFRVSRFLGSSETPRQLMSLSKTIFHFDEPSETYSALLRARQRQANLPTSPQTEGPMGPVSFVFFPRVVLSGLRWELWRSQTF